MKNKKSFNACIIWDKRVFTIFHLVVSSRESLCDKHMQISHKGDMPTGSNESLVFNGTIKSKSIRLRPFNLR